MREITLKNILDIINESDDLEINAEQLEESLPNLGMDSITFIQIIVKLEEAFDCEIPDSKLLISELDTVQKIYDLLRELYEAQSL